VNTDSSGGEAGHASDSLPDDQGRRRGEPVRRWPACGPLAPEECVETRCPHCSRLWRIHQRLAGYKLRCECDGWIDVPALPAPAPQLAGSDNPEEPLPNPRRLLGRRRFKPDDTGLVQVPRDFYHQVTPSRIPTELPMAPGTLRFADADNRTRWTNRTLIELTGIMCSFWVPMVFITIATDGRTQALYLPFAGLISGLLILVVGLSARHYTYSGLRAARVPYFLEAVTAAVVVALLALGWHQMVVEAMEGDGGHWLRVVKEELGIPWSVFVICVCPAVFEELAFRGLVQGRLSALFGTWTGIVVSGAAFGLAHGVTTGFPFHVFLGIQIGYLRHRSHSLYPGMLQHFLYNAILVLWL
jgi:membrane protease YdiL (CAAX protease family)